MSIYDRLRANGYERKLNNKGKMTVQKSENPQPKPYENKRMMAEYVDELNKRRALQRQQAAAQRPASTRQMPQQTQEQAKPMAPPTTPVGGAESVQGHNAFSRDYKVSLNNVAKQMEAAGNPMVASQILSTIGQKDKIPAKVRDELFNSYLQREARKKQYSYQSDPDAEKYIKESIGRGNPLAPDFAIGREDPTPEWINEADYLRATPAEKLNNLGKKYGSFMEDLAASALTGYKDPYREQLNETDKEALRYMTPEQQKEYSYLLGKDSYNGTQNAKAYADLLRDQSVEAEANRRYKDVANSSGALRALKLGGHAYMSGANSAWQNMLRPFDNAAQGRDEYIAPDAETLAYSRMRQDVSGIGGIAMDALQNSGHMLPTTIAGTAAAMTGAAPVAASALGSAMMVPQVAGSAYNEDVLQYGPKAAQRYALASALNEAGGEFLLGGVENVAGGFVQNWLTKTLPEQVLRTSGTDIMSAATKAFAKALQSPEADFLINGPVEGMEEIVQGTVDSVLRNAIFGEDNEINPFSEENLYSAFIAALSVYSSNVGPTAVNTITRNKYGSAGMNELLRGDTDYKSLAESIDVDPETYTSETGLLDQPMLQKAQEAKAMAEDFAEREAAGKKISNSEKAEFLDTIREVQSNAMTADFNREAARQYELYVENDEDETVAAKKEPAKADKSVAEIAEQQERMKAFQEGRTYNQTGFGAEFSNAMEARDAFMKYTNEDSVKMSDAATEHASNMYGHGGTANGGRFLQAYKHAYVAGYNDIDSETLIRSMPPGVLSDEQLMRAYQDGMEAKNKESRIRFTQGPAARKGGLTFAAPSATVAQRNVAQWIGNKTGLRIEIREGIKGGGEIDLNKGVLRINPYSRNFNQTLAHELTHLIRIYDQEGYGSFQKLAVEALMRSKNMTYDEVYAQYERTYAQSGTTPNVEDVIEEMTADAAGQFLNDEDFARSIVQQDRSLGEKILDFFNGIVESIRELISSKNLSRPSRALRENLETYTKARDIWMNALDTASERYKSGMVAEQADGLKYEINADYTSQIDEWDENGRDEYTIFQLGSTSSELQALGAMESDIYMKSGKLLGMMKKHPEIGIPEIKKIPNVIEHPIMMLKSKNDDTRLAIIGEDMASNGKPMMIILDLRPLEGTAKRFAVEDMQKMTSAYTKDNPIRNLIMSSDIVYINNKKATTLLEAAGMLTRPGASIDSDYIGSIEYTQRSVKIKGVPAGNLFQKDMNVKPKYQLEFDMSEPVEQTRDLIAVRNVDTANIMSMLDLEGLPSPSIAITKDSIGHTAFGDISFIFGRSTIDPQADRRNLVFDADAWTPIYPGIEYEYDKRKIHDGYDQIRSMKNAGAIPEYYAERVNSFLNRIEFSNSSSLEQIVEDAKSNYGMKEYYLASRGEAVPVIENSTTESMSEDDVKLSQWIIDTVGWEKLSQKLLDHPELRDDVRNAIHDYYMEEYGFSKTEADNAIRGMDRKEVARALMTAKNFMKNGATKTTVTQDFDGTEKAIDQKINQEDYETWLHEQFDDLITSKGIRNEKSYYTDSGNPRSFKQLHYPVTAENIVKAMWAGREQGAVIFSGMTAKSIRGAAANKYRSIEDIHKGSGRLQNISDGNLFSENEKALLDEADDRLLAVKQEVFNDNDIQLSGNVDRYVNYENNYTEAILDVANKKLNPKRTKARFAEYGVNLTDEQAQEIYDIIDDLRNLPTDYFEAKPKRVVGWNEIGMALVPDNTDPAIIDRMREKGIYNIRTYPAGDNEARLKMERNASDLKFQLEIDDDTDMAVEDNTLVRNNPQLRTATQTLGELLSAVDYMPSDESIERTARQLKKSTGTSVSQEEISAQLKTIYNYIAYNGHVNGTDISNIAADYAGELINKADNTEYNQADQQSYKEFRDTLKGYTFHVPAGFEGEINRLGGIAALRREFFGTLNLTKEKGIPIDTMWQELVELYPQYFDPEVSNPADQLEQLVDTIRALKPKPVSMFQNDEDMELYRYSVGQQIFQAYTNSGISDYSMRAGVEAQVRERMKNLQGKYQQQYDSALKQARQQLQEQRQAEKLRKMDREAKQYLLKQARELVRMKGGPAFEMAKQNLIKDLDLVAVGIRSDTVQKLQQLRREVDKQAAEDTDYAELEKPKFEKLLRRLENRHISDMSAEEIADLTQQIVALKHSQQTANRILKEELGQRVATVGRNLVEQQTRIKNQGRGIDATKTAEAMAKNYVLNMQSPMRALQMMDGHRKDGVLTSLAKDLNEGQTKKERFVMESEKMFREVLKDQELVKTFSRPDIEITDSNGRKAYISKGMRISLYLHSQNHQNMDHIGYGGVRIPNERLYKAGKYQDAYNAGQVITLKPTDVRKIISQMTDAELAYAEVAKKFFNEKTKAAINETSMILNGYEKATVANYFPIRTDPNFTQKEMSGLQMDGTIEGMGSLKERQEGAKNPILLEDVSQVIMRQMENTARYYGFAIPVRNFNKIWNYTSTGYGNSSKNAIIQTWGGAGSKYIENLVQDLQTGGRRAERDILDKLKSRYAGTALNLNLGVAIKQSASAPVAALVLDTKSVIKAFAGKNMVKKIDYDYIDSITPWSYSRRKGMSGTEVGETARQRTMVEMMDNGKLQKVKGFFNWIQNVDVWTTDRLILACEYYMEDHHPSLKKGTAEYDQKLGELIQEVFQRTQPSYDVMQRSEFLRSTGALSRVAGMFKTQTFNMGGEFLDALTAAKDMEVLAANGEASLEDVAAAKKQFYVKTVPALIVSQAMLAAFQVLADAVLHRMKKYRDKDGEVTAASVGKQMSKNFISSFPGLFMGGAELGSMIGSAYSSVMTGKLTWYDITLPALDSVNDMASSIVSFGTAIHKVMENGWTDETQSNFYQKLADLGMSGLIVRGIPANNIYNNINALYLHLQDVKNGEFGTFEAGNSILGLKDSGNSRATLYSRTFNRLYEKGDWDGFITEFNRMQNREGADKANKELIKLMRNTDEVQAAAQALMDGDKEQYKKNRQALIDKGFKTDVFRADITTAIQNEYAKLQDAENPEEEAEGPETWNGSDQLGGYKSSKLGAWIEAGYDEYDYIELTEATKGLSSDKDENGKDKKGGKTKQQKIGEYLANRTDLPKEVREAFWDTLYNNRKNMPKMK